MFHTKIKEALLQQKIIQRSLSILEINTFYVLVTSKCMYVCLCVYIYIYTHVYTYIFSFSQFSLIISRDFLLQYLAWMLNHVQLFVTPWTIQSMEFSRPEYWSG